MHIRPILDHADHETALREIETLWGADEGTEAGDRLDVLVTLVDAYEARRWPIASLDPVQAIEAAMAMNGRTRADLAAFARQRNPRPQMRAHAGHDLQDRGGLGGAGTGVGAGICVGAVRGRAQLGGGAIHCTVSVIPGQLEADICVSQGYGYEDQLPLG